MRGRCLSAVGAVLAIALFTLAASPCTAVLRTVLENTASATLVIDAGHGGFDGGAVSERGVSEQAINLSVAQRVRALACFFGVQTAMTRTDEGALDYDPSRSVRENKVADIHARERIVQSISSPVLSAFISTNSAIRSTTAHRCFTPRTAHSESRSPRRSSLRSSPAAIRKTADRQSRLKAPSTSCGSSPALPSSSSAVFCPIRTKRRGSQTKIITKNLLSAS